MDDKNQESHWLRLLAENAMEALREASQTGRFDVNTFTQALANRQGIMDLISEACREISANHASKEIIQKYKVLRAKYNEISDEIRHVENQSVEVEEAFTRLVNVLAAIAKDPTQAGLGSELKQLKQSLQQKIVPKRLDSSTQRLKNYLLRGEDTGEFMADKGADAGPESLEENIRDILISLVQDVMLFEEPTTQKHGKILLRKIKTDFTLEDFKPYTQEIHDLIFHFKEVIRREKEELYGFTEEIISRLEETEQDLLRNLDSGARRLGSRDNEFERQVAGDIQSIELSFDIEGATLTQVRARVLEKIASIRERFRKKREEDEALLRQLQAEKAGAEKRLTDINNKYQEFTSKSQAMLKEVEKFRQASLSDGLTKVYNRRAYDVQIENAIQALKKGQLSRLALIIFDIDHFKDFNNNYGHRAGDKILLHVARFAKETLRKEDFLSRYGGDEFAIILPEVDLKNAAKIAAQVLAGIAAVEFKIYRDHNLTVRVGLSMGVSAGRLDDDVASIFHRADQALYLAKEKGRNQVRTELEL